MTRASRREWLAMISAGALAAARCSRDDASLATGPCPALSGATIRWIVPNAVGGGYDTESRLIAPQLERRLNARISIENLPGAGQATGARAIAQAPADGRTVGILGVPGLLALALAGQAGVPNPAADFTILGRVSRSWHVWATGRGSPIIDLAAAMTLAATRPLVFAISEVSSPNFVSITGASDALGVPVELVAGFAGTRNASLAAVRGDVDLVSFNFDTIRDLIAAGDLRPLLQVSHPPGSSDPLLRGVPVLGGDDGEAARRARAAGRDPAAAVATSAALVDLVGTGRVVVAPRGLPGETTACLSAALQEALVDQQERESTRTLDVAAAEPARADVERAAARVHVLLPSLERALRALRR
jgi:tripartite-type tricarboxylate transporter receptor subunit TctC